MPQDMSVCVNQVGSLGPMLPLSSDGANKGDGASQHIAETCLHCQREVHDGDGEPLYMEDTLLGYMHPECIEDWMRKFLYLTSMRRRGA